MIELSYIFIKNLSFINLFQSLIFQNKSFSSNKIQLIFLGFQPNKILDYYTETMIE
jgi:hypothetical protein